MDEHPSTMRAHKLPNIYEHFMELLFGLYVPSHPIQVKARPQRRSATGESSMWIKEVAPEWVAETVPKLSACAGSIWPKGQRERLVEGIATKGEKPDDGSSRRRVRVNGIPRAFCPAR